MIEVFWNILEIPVMITSYLITAIIIRVALILGVWFTVYSVFSKTGVEKTVKQTLGLLGDYIYKKIKYRSV